MVKGNHKSKVESQRTEVERQMQYAFLIFALCLLPLDVLFGQQPGPVFSVNAKGVQGVGPATWTYGGTVNLYVALSGNDTTGTGTVGNPYRTIGRALQDVPVFVSHHYIVNLAAGTYREQVNIAGRYFGTNLVGNFNKASVEIKGDPASPDSYVISGADEGAPTTPIRDHVVACTEANCIVNGVSLQYGKVYGLYVQHANAVAHSSTFRHFTTTDACAVGVRQYGALELRGNNTISDASIGVFADAFGLVTSHIMVTDLFTTGWPTNGTFTITGITGGAGLYIEETGSYNVAGATNITGTNVPGSYGIYAHEYAKVVATTASIASFPTLIYGNASSEIYIDSAALSNASTGVRLLNDSLVDWFVSDPTFTSVTTPYDLAGGSRVIHQGPANTTESVHHGYATSSFSPASQFLLGKGVYNFAALNSGERTVSLLGLTESNTSDNSFGLYGATTSRHSSGTKPNAVGIEGDAYQQVGGTVSDLAGVFGYAQADAGTTTRAYGIGGMAYTTAGNATTMAGAYLFRNAKDAGGTVASNYGLYIEDQADVGSSNWSIFAAGTAPSSFGGSVISGRSVIAAVNTVAFSSVPTFDAALGNTQKITLSGNVTSSTLSNATAGQWLHFVICQDATGNRTFVWPSNVKGGMTIGSTASTCSAQNFVFDGTNAYALSSGVTNM